MQPLLPSLRHAAAVFAAGALLAAVLTGWTESAFSDVTSNPGNSFHAAASFDCAEPGTVTLTAAKDSWLDENSDTANFGSDQILHLRSQSGGNDMRVIVGFDVEVPEGCQVTDARLRLYTSSAVGGRTLLATRVSESWAENSVTWNNQPPTTGASASTGSGYGWREWNVTDQVQAGGAQHGWIVGDQTEEGPGEEQQFHSREEGSNPPRLVLTFG
jgi:hypothetical protein